MNVTRPEVDLDGLGVNLGDLRMDLTVLGVDLGSLEWILVFWE